MKDININTISSLDLSSSYQEIGGFKAVLEKARTLNEGLGKALDDLYIADHLPSLANLSAATETRLRQADEVHALALQESIKAANIDRIILHAHQAEIKAWEEKFLSELKSEIEVKSFCLRCLLAQIVEHRQLEHLLALAQEIYRLKMEINNLILTLNQQILFHFTQLLRSDNPVIYHDPSLNLHLTYNDVINYLAEDVINNKISIDKIINNPREAFKETLFSHREEIRGLSKSKQEAIFDKINQLFLEKREDSSQIFREIKKLQEATHKTVTQKSQQINQHEKEIQKNFPPNVAAPILEKINQNTPNPQQARGDIIKNPQQLGLGLFQPKPEVNANAVNPPAADPEAKQPAAGSRLRSRKFTPGLSQD